MKLIVFTLCLLAGFAILTASVEAKEIIDLQNYVTCGLTKCSLEVDINELSLTSEAKNFLKNTKQTDLSSAVSKLPKEISGLDYYIKDKEKLIVTANIEPASSNYWFMEFTDFVLDPWFNSTTWSNWTNPDTTGNPGNDVKNIWFGYSIITDGITNGYEYDIYVRKNAGATGTTCSIWFFTNESSGGDWIANATITDHVCKLSNIALLNETKYNIFVDSTTRTYGSGNFPYASAWFDVNNSAYKYATGTPEWTYAVANTFTIEDINISYTESVYYIVELFIDGTQSNISHEYDAGTSHNLTVISNMSVPLNIMINGTSYASGTGTANYTGVFGVGFYTVVGNWSGNATHSAGSYTLSMNITNATPAPPAVPAISYKICYDNTTLLNNISVYNGGVLSNNYTYAWCEYGCDNITKACYPTPYEESIYNFGVIILVIIGVGLIYRYGRR